MCYNLENLAGIRLETNVFPSNVSQICILKIVNGHQVDNLLPSEKILKVLKKKSWKTLTWRKLKRFSKNSIKETNMKIHSKSKTEQKS